MMNYTVLALFLNLLSIPFLTAQEQSDSTHHPSPSVPTVWEIIGSDAHKAWGDGLMLFSAPTRFGASQWLQTGAIVGGTALTFAVDEPIRVAAQCLPHTQTLTTIMSVGEVYGRVEVAGILAGGIYVSGLVFQDSSVRKMGRMVFESLLFAGLTTTILKSVIGRSRPYTNEGAFKYRGFQFETATTALPSGHTTVAFAVSSTLAAQIDNPYIAAGLYALAGLTFVERIYDDKHWASDALLGAAIGTVIGQAVVHLNRNQLPSQSFSWHCFPVISPQYYGCTIIVAL
jgi:membrane-associated phospholipid phosphatase